MTMRSSVRERSPTLSPAVSRGSSTDGRGMTIRTIAVEDDARYRSSLELLLENSPEFELVETFASPYTALGALEAALRRNRRPGWDLILMDLDLPGMSGIECIRQMKVLLPGVTIVVLTVLDQEAAILEAICAGADGYLVKRTPADKLLAQLRVVMEGGSPLSVGVARTLLDVIRQLSSGAARNAEPGALALGLTDREQDVLRCLVQGMSYGMAADQLKISIDTVRSHIRNIYAKLQVHTVAGAVSRALRERLV
jgi:DNA-binding NarL/FixJ family response regulator